MKSIAGFRAPLASLVAVALLGGFLASCGKQQSADPLARIRERGTLIVGVFGDKPPFGYIDEQGRNAGYDVAIVRELARSLLGDGEKVQFVTLEAANRVAFLQADKVDIVFANFTRTPERAEQVDFAHPYMKVALGLIVPAESPVRSVADLKGRTLILNKGTTAEAFIAKNHPGTKQLKFDQNTESFQALKDGRGDALLHDNALLFAWAQQNPGFTVVEANLGNPDVIAPAVRKGNTALLAWLNQELERFGREGFIRKAYDQELRPHFGDSVPDPATVYIEPPGA